MFTRRSLLWGYNTRNELIAADRHEGTDPLNPGPRYATNGDFDYAYDPIGNRTTYRRDVDPPTSYTTNNVNQYTLWSSPYGNFDLTYDADGNLASGLWLSYLWDGENRLKAVYPMCPFVNDVGVEFDYDYKSRRVRKRVLTWTGSAWAPTPTKDERFVYDEWNVIMVLDGRNNNAITRKYTWGLDLSGLSGNGSVAGIHGAGGIGGLLAVNETATTNSPSYWFFYDGNGNVGQVLAASDQSIAARYEYDPYGNTIVSAGPYAGLNPFRFSTKWWDDETGLGYWGYRYYSAWLGRFLNRDPINEPGAVMVRQAARPATAFIPRDPMGVQPAVSRFVHRNPVSIRYRIDQAGATMIYVDGMNLYVYTRNNPHTYIDPLGLDAYLVSYRDGLGRGHTWVCVDVWHNGQKAGVACYDLVFSTSLANDHPWYHRPKDLVEIAICSVCGFPGRVNKISISSISFMSGKVWRHRMGPVGDGAAGALLDGMVGDTYYNALGRNCSIWAKANFDFIKKQWPE